MQEAEERKGRDEESGQPSGLSPGALVAGLAFGALGASAYRQPLLREGEPQRRRRLAAGESRLPTLPKDRSKAPAASPSRRLRQRSTSPTTTTGPSTSSSRRRLRQIPVALRRRSAACRNQRTRTPSAASRRTRRAIALRQRIPPGASCGCPAKQRSTRGRRPGSPSTARATSTSTTAPTSPSMTPRSHPAMKRPKKSAWAASATATGSPSIPQPGRDLRRGRER